MHRSFLEPRYLWGGETACKKAETAVSTQPLHSPWCFVCLSSCDSAGITCLLVCIPFIATTRSADEKTTPIDDTRAACPAVEAFSHLTMRLRHFQWEWFPAGLWGFSHLFVTSGVTVAHMCCRGMKGPLIRHILYPAVWSLSYASRALCRPSHGLCRHFPWE